MEYEHLIFEKKGWRLSEIPYNFQITHAGRVVYYTSLPGAIRWIAQNSRLSIEELRELTKGCNERPYRIDPGVSETQKRVDDEKKLK